VAEADLFLDIVLVTAAALIGGLLANALRLPTILGFLAAGVLIGPHTPGPVGNVSDVEEIADLGVIFLMFGLGIQVSFRELLALRRVALVGGALQVASVFLVSAASGLALGLDWRACVLLGFLIAISSTAVVIKLLEGRQEIGSLHGRAAIGIAVFQDLAVVLMMVSLPALGEGSFTAVDLLLAVLEGAALIVATYLLSTYVMPLLWRRIAFTRSRELSLLASVTLAVGLATGSALLGLSVAFGAFLAGLAISENEFGFQTLSDILPLREVFATVFFVAMGMLIVPSAIHEEAELVVVITLIATVGKAVLTTGAVRSVGMPIGPAIMTGLVLSQVGEFSFVLARTGLEEGVIDEGVGSAFLAAAFLTIVISPLLFQAGPALIEMGRRQRRLAPLLQDRIADTLGEEDEEALRRHVIICGYGATGAAMVASMAGRGLPYVIVDNNPFLVETARERGLPLVYGDATRPEVLERCRVEEARVLAVTLPNLTDARATVLNARNLNPSIDVVARGTGFDAHALLRGAGAAEVVEAEFEASLEFIRHVLHRYGLDAREIIALQARRRAEHYGFE
jgi:CPA2 family monovalent cation:H+ antiporter-2